MKYIYYSLKGIALFLLVGFVISLIMTVANASEPSHWMLMEAPDATDIGVENMAYQINGAPTLEDCMEMLATHTSDKHRWCEPVIQPLDMVAELEAYHGS